MARAAGNGASEIVRRLIEAGADVNAFNGAGYSTLHMAATSGCLQTVEILLITPQVEINSLTRKAEPRGGEASALMIAAELGENEIVKMLLNAGADPAITNSRGKATIYLGVRSGHVHVVDTLLDFNVDIDALEQISEAGDTDLSALMMATLDDTVQMLEILLSKGRPNINLRNSRGITDLMIAVKAEKIEATRLLLSREMIDVDVADDDGWTPLMAAADIGLFEIIPELVAKGANVNVQSNSGWTPILLAADGGHAIVVEMLLSSEGILLDTSETSDGRTALHYTVGWGNARLVELLLSKGANTGIRDKVNHFRAVDYALYFNDKNVLDLFEARVEKRST